MGFAPFWSGWWAHCESGANWAQNSPLSLPQSLLHCLFFHTRLGNRSYCFPLASLGGAVLYVDAAYDIDRFKIGVWGPRLGGPVFPCSPSVFKQQEAELEALIDGVRVSIRVGWPMWRLIGDNSSALEQVASLRSNAGLRLQNRHLRRLFYLLQCLEGLVYLEFVPGDLNPADSLSREDSEWNGLV